jgi:hypothetical protein
MKSKVETQRVRIADIAMQFQPILEWTSKSREESDKGDARSLVFNLTTLLEMMDVFVDSENSVTSNPLAKTADVKVNPRCSPRDSRPSFSRFYTKEKASSIRILYFSLCLISSVLVRA